MSVFTSVSPADWQIAEPGRAQQGVCKNACGHEYDDLKRRWENATGEFLLRHFDRERGAFCGHYSAPEKRSEAPNLTNLIAPLQCLAMYDRTRDAELLRIASSAGDYVYKTLAVWWPMHMWQGAVSDTGEMGGKAWVKYSAEMALLHCALYERTGQSKYLDRARQNAAFLKQAARHDHRFTFDLRTQEWEERGWQSFGRVIEAYLALYAITGEQRYLDRAVDWGEFGTTLQAPNGCFYLIDDYFYNTDIAPNEIRGLIFLYDLTGNKAFLQSARRYADWHLDHQRDDGAWYLAMDRDDELVAPVVGPGDPANIGLSLLLLHMTSGEEHYLASAVRALRYCVSLQAAPGGKYEDYLDDPRVQWGFWSWDPPVDYTLCGDQSVHHVRLMMFLADYLCTHHEEGSA